MTTTETYRYRGYDIVPIWQWRNHVLIFPAPAPSQLRPRAKLTSDVDPGQDLVR